MNQYIFHWEAIKIELYFEKSGCANITEIAKKEG